ncbi:MAG: COX15/CtaA family protein [Actinomycetes bacterium]
MALSSPGVGSAGVEGTARADSRGRGDAGAVRVETASTPVASAAAPRQRRPARVAGPWTRRILLLNVVAQVGIVLTGGLVRLTGSGLGCPTWPQCVPGSYTPVVHQAQGFHKYIEFGNRTLTSVVSITALLALVAAWRLGRRRLRLVAVLPLLGVALQAAIGGVTVLTGLNPATVALHFLVSMLLVAVSVLLLLRAQEGDARPRPVVPAPARHLAAVLAAVGAVVLVLGTVVTGSGPHSGDADTPARFPLDPRTVSWLHADLVLLFLGLLAGLLVALALVKAPAVVQRRARWVLGVALAQGLVGYVQYFTGLPEMLVLVHMLGASLLVVTLTALLVSLRRR